MNSETVVMMLYSNFCSQRGVETKQYRARHLFYVKGVYLREIDGSDPMNKRFRNNLFDLCCNNHKEYKLYPQFFIIRGCTKYPESIKYVGDWETICAWNENNKLISKLLQIDSRIAILPHQNP